MAQRRMFSSKIISSARFLKMPIDSQLLYFHLGMHADDDGVVEAYTVLKSTGANEDNLKVLVAKGLVRVLNEDLVTFITDWSEHNLIRADRKIDSIYKTLLLQIMPEIDLIEPKPRADTGVLTGGRPVDAIGKGRLGQDRVGEVSLGKDNIIISSEQSSQVQDMMKIFYEINPTLNFGNKTIRGSAERLIKRLGSEKALASARAAVAIFGQKYAPTITTPAQLETKLSELVAFYKKNTQKAEENKITFVGL